MNTASAVSTASPVRRTPTKAALKSYDSALVQHVFPMRDPLYLDLESDPLGGDNYVDLFNEDSDGDDIPCGQQENMERLLQLAKELGSQNKNFRK